MAKKSFFSSSSNPFMNEKAFQKSTQGALDADLASGPITKGERMTAQGAVNKSFILFGIMLVTAVVSFANPHPLFMWGGAIGGLIVVLIAAFKQHLSPTLAPLYAALEGLFVGALTAIYAAAFAGIVFQAVTLTFALLFLMLFFYKAGIIKVTEKLRSGVMMATGAVLLVYVVNMVMGFFGVNLPYLHQGGMIGIGISLVIIGIASMNLLLDFDNFEKGEQYGAPAYMEWFSAMGLLITLVWLYVEILRLLSMLSGRD